MRNKKYVFFFIFILFIACKQSKTRVLIQGKVQNSASNSLFIQIGQQKDTIKVDKNGEFEYRLNLKNPEFVRIIVPETNKKLLLLVDTLDQITLNFNAHRPDSTASIIGSQGSILLQNIQKKYFASINKMQNINRQFEKEKLNASKETFERIRTNAIDSLKACIDSEIAFLISFIKTNSSSLASITALYQTFDNETGRPLLIDVPNGMSYFELVDSTLLAKYPTSITVQDFHQAYIAVKMAQVKETDYQTPTKTEHPLIKVGDKAPEFNANTIDGSKCTLQQYRGKMVLLDFWASWCMPCRKENPKLVNLFNKYNPKGLEIIQISLDNTIEDLRKAIEVDKLPWNVHICELKSWQSPIVMQFMIKAIPQSILIGKDGKIAAICINNEELHKILKKHFK